VAARLLRSAGALLLFPAALLADDLPSTWRPEGVTGDPLSWAGVPFEREAGLDIGAVNNSDYLWVCLYPSNLRVQHQLLLGGATVWVLNEDGDRLGAVRFRSQPSPGDPPLRPPQGPRDFDVVDLRRRADAMLSSFEILDGDGDRIETRARAEAGEVEVRVEASEYVYFVVRIPLARVEAALLALGAPPGTTIGLGIETPRLERPNPMRGGPGPHAGPEEPPDEEDPAEPEGPRPDPFPYIPPEPIRFWTVLELASPGKGP